MKLLGGSLCLVVDDIIPLSPKGPVLGFEEERLHPADILPSIETLDDRGSATWGKPP